MDQTYEKICSYVKPLIQSELRGEFLFNCSTRKFLFKSWIVEEDENGKEKIVEEYSPTIVDDPLEWFDKNSIYVEWQQHAEALDKIEKLTGPE